MKMKAENNAIYFENRKEVVDVVYALAIFHTLPHASEKEEMKSVSQIMRLMQKLYKSL